MLIGLGWVSLEHPPGKSVVQPQGAPTNPEPHPDGAQAAATIGSCHCLPSEKGGLTVEVLFLPPVVNKCPADGSSGSKELNI